jgi:hypothetical protein
MPFMIPVNTQNYIRFSSLLADHPGYTASDMFEIMLDCLEKHQDSDYPLENKKEAGF